MQTFLYIIIFIIGCFFGSFCTLAVYRIPKKEDILIKHSYCPNCNHKLGFLDLFPLFSYIFLRGKCRYCKIKIRPRYFIIELCSGIAFLLLAISLKVNIDNLNIISLLFNFIYVSILVIIAGILFKINKYEWALCILCFAIIISGELFNTAIENIVDMVMPYKNEKAKLIKDISAGGVLVLAIGAAGVGLIVFVPKILR